MKSMASRADGHGRGHDGGKQREICGCAARDMWMRSERYVVRSGVVGTAGVRDGVRSGMAMRAAVG